MSAMTPSQTEILPPALSKREAGKLETTARHQHGRGTRELMRLCITLRRLQDGGAHLVRGYKNFGTYAEATFSDLSASAAQQASRQGHVLLVLAEAQRLSEDKPNAVIGATGARALASILNQHGQEVMVAVFDAAAQIATPVVKETVDRAAQALLPAAPTDLPALSEDLGLVAAEVEEADLPEELHQLLDRIHLVRQALDDLGLEVSAGLARPAQAKRVAAELGEETDDLQTALRDQLA